VASLAARPDWQTLRSTLQRAGRAERTAVHGELRTDHVVVPSTSGTPTVAVLGRPGRPAVADPAIDLGSLFGDLFEVALLGSRAAAMAADAAFDGYVDGDPVDDALWSRAAGYAALKVVDHELRLRASRSVDTSVATVNRLDTLAQRVARELADLAAAPRRRAS
jgi:hypothetical protein